METDFVQLDKQKKYRSFTNSRLIGEQTADCASIRHIHYLHIYVDQTLAGL